MEEGLKYLFLYFLNYEEGKKRQLIFLSSISFKSNVYIHLHILYRCGRSAWSNRYDL
jgi:hypothetical protein